jgi:putative glutathione S-transferase
MGMLINGHWSETDDIIHNGYYQRALSLCKLEIDASEFLSQPKRYHLIASWSCPWSHRTMLLRQVLGLNHNIPLHITGGKKIQGYPANHGQLWRIPGTNINITHLHELYRINQLNYTGRSTVPILWDSQQLKIVSNESTDIIQLFERASKTSTLDLVPAHLKKSIEMLNIDIYNKLSNGVYKAAFAQTQDAYEDAVSSVFSMLEQLNATLSKNRFLMGDNMTLADWLLFPCLVRFDIDYYLHSKCCYKKLIEYPHLWRYSKEIYHMPGIAQTVNFNAIHQSNNHDEKVLSIMPSLSW